MASHLTVLHIHTHPLGDTWSPCCSHCWTRVSKHLSISCISLINGASIHNFHFILYCHTFFLHAEYSPTLVVYKFGFLFRSKVHRQTCPCLKIDSRLTPKRDVYVATHTTKCPEIGQNQSIAICHPLFHAMPRVICQSHMSCVTTKSENMIRCIR